MRMSLEAELPLGLALAMAQKPEAVERFSTLTEEEREAVIVRARSVTSRKEMRACVDSLLSGEVK